MLELLGILQKKTTPRDIPVGIQDNGFQFEVLISPKHEHYDFRT